MAKSAANVAHISCVVSNDVAVRVEPDEGRSVGDVAARAQREIEAAGDALLRVNAQLAIIERAFKEDNLDGFDAYALLKTALEVCGTYAERAMEQADYFAEVQHA